MSARSTEPAAALDERFTGDTLDPAVWFPYYLPHWSSRAASAADWSIRPDGLHLRIGPDHPRWAPAVHEEPLRVSCLQTGSFAGPVGSAVGQQPFRAGLTVQEAQPTMWGWTPRYGTVEVRMRGTVTARSMIACWLAGIEDRPERSGEVCIAEIFGSAVSDGHAGVGMGVHAFRDPALVEDFAALRLPLDVAGLHTYTVEWAPGSLRFLVDGDLVRSSDQAPDYPMQLMVGVFDFPDRAPAGEGEAPVAELVVARVVGRPIA